MYVDEIDVKIVFNMLDSDFDVESVAKIDKTGYGYFYGYILGKLSVLRNLGIISCEESGKYEKRLDDIFDQIYVEKKG